MRDQLTIFIPTYERADFIRRQCAYWAGSGFRVLILDGSAEPFDEPEVLNVDKNIRYFYEPVSFRERLVKSAELCDTAYVAMLADDDLYFKAGLDECINFLNQNDGFTTVFGQALGFSIGRHGQVVSARAYDELRNYAVDSDRANERLGYHMANYLPCHMYAVSRSESWKQAVAFQGAHQFSFFAQSEVQLEMALCVLGKSRVLSIPLWLRSREAPSVGITHPFDEGLRISVPFNKFWHDREHEYARNLFVDIAVRYLGSFLDTENGSKRDIIRAACGHFAGGLPTNFTRQQNLKNMLIQLQQLPFLGFVYQTVRDYIKGHECDLPSGVSKYLNCDNQLFLDEAHQIQTTIEASDRF